MSKKTTDVFRVFWDHERPYIATAKLTPKKNGWKTLHFPQSGYDFTVRDTSDWFDTVVEACSYEAGQIAYGLTTEENGSVIQRNIQRIKNLIDEAGSLKAE